ncbi:MAG TPA: hypothetical protein VNO84_16830 [Burkholderiaceae bacterium]|nr:hypothetical protein [Burkholderiaceae bacterium]
MKKIAVLLDDALHAQQRLQSVAPQGEVLWVLVACAPRLTHRASKWVAHGAREHWRAKWAARVFDAMRPWLEQRGWRFEALVARGPLPPLLAQLRADEVIDARRPKLGPPAGGPEPAPAARSGLGGDSTWMLLVGSMLLCEA